MSWREVITASLINARGWRTSERIIVFESDDWGSVRMRDHKAKKALQDFGIRVDNCPYLSNDALESAADVEALLEVLGKHKDSYGHSARFTLNTIMANPDFDKIRANKFNSYMWEHFHRTYERYGYPLANMLSLWDEGISNKVIRPQFHGREHIQINRWMKGLQSRSPESLKAFDLEILGVSTTVTREKRASYLPAFDFDEESEIENQLHIVTEGLLLFEKTFGFTSKSFIAPNYTWGDSVERSLSLNNVIYIQGARAQRYPKGGGETRIVRHFMGERNSLNQIYTLRNVQFEPSLNTTLDWVGRAMQQIELAFFWKKPAIVSTHRLNYVGGISVRNRDVNLKSLDTLLRQILNKYPNCRFLFSDELKVY